MRPTPINKELIDNTIREHGIQDFAKATIREVLEDFGVNDAMVAVVDKGALDFVIRARMQCAICRAAEIEYDWGKEDPHV